MTTGLDRRLFAYRDDLAADSLRGRVNAAAFVAGTPGWVSVGLAPLHRRPGRDAPMDTQLLRGDRVTILERRGDGWLWVQNARDGYVGYVPPDSVSDAAMPSTHRVVALRTFIYPVPDMKRPPLQALPLASEVGVAATDGAFAQIGPDQWVWADHLRPRTEAVEDFVALAERFVGAPYLWGGNSPDGTDCSGLVQVALRMANRDAPRDSDMQESGLGDALPVDLSEPRRRGDLIFWKGHVGIMTDARTLLHANGHHMLVVTEPLADAVARIAAKGGGPVTAVRRLAAEI